MRLYRALLHLYPASFRVEYGDELLAAFVSQRRGATGLPALLATTVLALADVVPNALAAHWEILRRDIAYASRSLRRGLGFATTAVLVVALGVGANTAAFSVANFVLLRPLPFAEPGQLVRLWQTQPGYDQMEMSPPNFADWKAAARSFSDMAAYTGTAMNLTGSGEPRRLQITLMSWNMPSLLGVHAMLGRTFSPSDTVAAQSALLSYDLWQTQFGADSSIVGRRIQLDGAPYIVVGVMPRDFRFPSRDADLWTTLQYVGSDYQDRTNTFLDAVGRLRNGVTVEQARSELRVIAARLEKAYPKADEKIGSTVQRMADDVSPRNQLLLYALCGAALCILLLACANLANLLLVRAVSREREIAVRTALGAGRERITRQLVTESLILVALGTAAGVLIAVLALPALEILVPSTLPIDARPVLDARVLVLASIIVALTGVGFGVVPALRSAAPIEALRDGARTSGGRKQRVRAALVMIEIMASVVLLISSALLMRAMWRLQAIDPGFRADNVLTLRTALPSARYGDPEIRYRFYTQVLGEVRALPGVTNAAYVTGLPLAMRGGIWPVTPRGETETRSAANSASLRYATPAFFATLGIPIRRGRDIADNDDSAHPRVAVVSESFANRYWPNEDPIGKHFNFAFHDRAVVGVVGDVRMRGFERSAEPQVYIPPLQADSAFLMYYIPKDLVIRTMAGAALLPEIRRIVHDADPSQPISNVQMLADVVAAETALRASQLRVLEILAAIAVLLATVGIHGLLSFTVSRRAQEIGVRVALGAKPSSILSMFLREGIVLGVSGLVPGVVVAYAAGRGMQALLAGVAPADPVAMIGGVLVCAMATLFGCLRPARRAARIDPIAALRAE